MSKALPTWPEVLSALTGVAGLFISGYAAYQAQSAAATSQNILKNQQAQQQNQTQSQNTNTPIHIENKVVISKDELTEPSWFRQDSPPGHGTIVQQESHPDGA